MGWSTWCTNLGWVPCLDDYCDEDEIKSVAKAMATNGMKDLGYEYILLDDCWAGPRLANGTITAELDRFPSGTLKPLADYVHSLGLKIGLYTDVGEKTCKGDRPGSWPYYEQDAKVYASWSMDMVKMDWCGHPGGYSAQQLYTMMRDALNKTGRPMFFMMCEWGLFNVWEWAMPVGNSWRIGPDHIPLWWTPATTQDPGEGQGTANIIEHFAGLSKYAGPGGWNDADFLMPGYFWMGYEDQKTEFSFWSLVSSPLLVATDIRHLGDKQVVLNKEVIQVNQDPLGIPGDRRQKYRDGGEVWSRYLSDGTWAVILYNSNIFYGTANVTVRWNSDDLPNWPNGVTKAKVRDMWAHQDLGPIVGSFSYSLQPHVSMMYKVTPVK